MQRLRPAYVNFAISERDLLRVRARLPAGHAGKKSAVGTLPVRATLQGESKTSAEGVLDFIDNGVSLSTGSMQLRARFANQDLHLIPGLYAKASINAGPPRQAVLVPNAILQADQQGSYVYVVNARDVAMRRNVTLGEQFGSEREVRAGLQPGERIVTEGLANIVDGQPVKFKTAAAATSPPAPTVKASRNDGQST